MRSADIEGISGILSVGEPASIALVSPSHRESLGIARASRDQYLLLFYSSGHVRPELDRGWSVSFQRAT